MSNTPTKPNGCAVCSRPLVFAHTWLAASLEERAQWRSWGWAKYAGKGMCARCYRTASKRSTAPTRATTRVERPALSQTPSDPFEREMCDRATDRYERERDRWWGDA